ncbi:hypothetical protein PPTS312_12350 [Pseudomonas putida]|uniref:Uncharacterized protein n=1 Tax=Pseudomonas putida TaxID=303 RepID=A0A7U6LZS0_PSEPU|nr:hypothetical protein PPTS312_12350 [Pseudomonas putida]
MSPMNRVTCQASVERHTATDAAWFGLGRLMCSLTFNCGSHTNIANSGAATTKLRAIDHPHDWVRGTIAADATAPAAPIVME